MFQNKWNENNDTSKLSCEQSKPRGKLITIKYIEKGKVGNNNVSFT